MTIHWRRSALVLLGLILVSVSPGRAQDDALSFFKNYFLTGGYKVAGVGLAGQGVNGVAEGVITIEGVPPDAEIVAAFMYAQVVSADGPEAGAAGVTFHGVPLSAPEGTFAVIGDPNGATPCWSSGGGTGQSGGTKRTFSYRYDVLRFLPVVNGRQQANGDHPVGLPDLGSSNATPIALGASLVLIYRDPDMPLSAFVIYDGSWAMDNSTQGMMQTVEGFYDPAPVAGEMTHIVGSGQANKSENLRVNGAIAQVLEDGVVVRDGVNAFRGFEGEAWDNVTVVTPNLMGADYLTTSVDNVGFPSFDCLTWSAVIYRTEVNDYDSDGLLDAWELNSGLTDPNGVMLPDLAAMGAKYDHKDIFVEVGYMKTDPSTSPDGSDGVTYGGSLKPHHTHLPTAEALTKVVEAFAAAPVSNPDGDDGINVHFDVGINHQGVSGVIPSGLARGGEALDEMATVCQRDEDGTPPDDPQWVCQFSEYPGTVGWKSGFRALRDALVEIPPEGEQLCDSPTNDGYDDGPDGNCERVFDRNRKDIFRYMFFAHALGVPKAHCLIVDEADPNFGLPDLDCQETEPLFHVPNTYTGVGDWGGADAMVTMGGFTNADGLPVGTDNQTAGTIMHELGHTLMLRHGGAPDNPNCSPNYLSVMNYLFQLRGLVRDGGEHAIDYSGQTLDSLDESYLDEWMGLGGSPSYRTAWYAPYGGIGSAATRHCDGSAIADGAQMIRVDGTDVGGPIDWNADGDTSDNAVQQDVNFDGVPNDSGAPLAGFNDWEHLRLNQVGARRNVGVWFFADGFPYMGPASLDMTRGDFGKFDFGKFDFGNYDFGKFDFGKFDFGDLNQGDLGKFDFGKFDFGKFDFGKFDFGVGAGDLGRGSDGKGGFGKFDFGKFDFGGGGDEVTITVAVAAGLLGPPTGLESCVADNLGEPACTVDVDGEGPRVLTTWSAPDALPAEYRLYRRTEGATGFALVATVSPASGVDGAFEVVDGTVEYDTTYEYYVAARYEADGEFSEIASNVVTVTINPPFYVVVPVRNLPPNRQNTGSTFPIDWQFSLDGSNAIDSSDAAPVVSLVSYSNGIEFQFNSEDPGSSGFKPPTADNGWTWSFNIQLTYPAWHTNAGQDLPGAKDYQVTISSWKMETGKPFVSGTFEIRAAKGGQK